MKLPNAELVIVDLRKLRDYCLNLDHPRGRRKASVFASVGIGQSENIYVWLCKIFGRLDSSEVAPVWLRGGPVRSTVI